MTRTRSSFTHAALSLDQHIYTTTWNRIHGERVKWNKVDYFRIDRPMEDSHHVIRFHTLQTISTCESLTSESLYSHHLLFVSGFDPIHSCSISHMFCLQE